MSLYSQVSTSDEHPCGQRSLRRNRPLNHVGFNFLWKTEEGEAKGDVVEENLKVICMSARALQIHSKITKCYKHDSETEEMYEEELRFLSNVTQTLCPEMTPSYCLLETDTSTINIR